MMITILHSLLTNMYKSFGHVVDYGFGGSGWCLGPLKLRLGLGWVAYLEF